MNHPTDTNTRFIITMSSVGGVRITEKHDIYIDDISLEEVESAQEPDDPQIPEDPDDPQDPTDPNDPVDPPAPYEPTPEGPEPHDAIDPHMYTKWGRTYCIDVDGYVMTGFFFDRYFAPEKDGAMVSNKFFEVDGQTYYAKSDGTIAKNEIMTKWFKDYLFGVDGELLYGFNEFYDDLYYSNEKGVIAKSAWIDEGEERYYAKSNGHIARGETITRWGKKYSFDENGKLIR
jgi:hypothetical protein